MIYGHFSPFPIFDPHPKRVGTNECDAWYCSQLFPYIQVFLPSSTDCLFLFLKLIETWDPLSCFCINTYYNALSRHTVLTVSYINRSDWICAAELWQVAPLTNMILIATARALHAALMLKCCPYMDPKLFHCIIPWLGMIFHDVSKYGSVILPLCNMKWWKLE